MRIAINALASTSGGGYTYLRQLVSHLLQVDNLHNYIIFSQVTWEERAALRASHRVDFIQTSKFSLGKRLFYEQVLLPKILRQQQVDILFSPAEIASLAAFTNQVLGIQNPNPYQRVGLSWPLRQRLRFLGLRWLAFISTRAVDHIVFVSQTAREQTMKVLRQPQTPGSVVYHGVDLERFLHQKDNLVERSGILCVAAVERHKNLEVLLKAYAGLNQAIRCKHPLTVVGKVLNRPYLQELQQLMDDFDIVKDVTFMGEIAFEEVPEVYRQARVFILPSLLETFGMPLIEAMASGVPVLASDTSCLPEVCGKAALYFDPHNPSELTGRIIELLTDVELSETMRQRGWEKCLNYSWENCARQMLNIFEGL